MTDSPRTDAGARSRRSVPLVAALATASLLALASAPRAEEIVIGQKGKTFSRIEVVLKKGDSIVFVNDDAVTHSVFSRSPGFAFNLKVQKPGEQKVIVFERPGVASVRCAIHPKMELTVKVED